MLFDYNYRWHWTCMYYITVIGYNNVLHMCNLAVQSCAIIIMPVYIPSHYFF